MSDANDIMWAIRLDGPCGTDEMKPVRVETPELKPGFVVIKVKAFGVNESEVTSRRGESDGDFTFPRILGIEGVGIVEAANPGSALHPGQPVVAMMGGMGREYDGSYAEYMCVRESAVIPVDTDVVKRAGWAAVGAADEMAQTAYGTIVEGAEVGKGSVLLVHGGTSNVGLMCIVLGKWLGATVIATSRSESRLDVVRKYGADVALVDDETLHDEIRKRFPDGIDAVAGFVGIKPLLADTAVLREHGKACYTGSLDGIWAIDGFSPFMITPKRYLTSYAGEASDLPAHVLNEILADVADGKVQLPIAKVYHGLDKAGEAQANLESHAMPGKHVVVLDD